MAGGEVFYSSYIAIFVLNAFFCCTAIVLNSVTIHAVRKTLSLSKTLKTLLLSLAVSDLGVGLFAQPLKITFLVIKSKQITENDPAFDATFIPTASLLSTNLFVFASFFGVMALSADRFLAIHLHLRYKELVTRKRVVAVVVSIWVFSAALPSLFRLWIPANIVYVIGPITCVTCVTVTAFLNYKIYMAVRRHAHQVQVLQRLQQAAQTAQVATVQKSAVTSIYIYIVFLVCYLPNAGILCAMAIKLHPINVVIQQFAITVVYLNSSLNPFIYCWKMRHIRHSVMNILRSTLSCRTRIVYRK